MITFAIAAGLFLLPSVTDTLAQFPQLKMKDKNMLPLNITNSIYNSNTSEFLGSKNISSTPYKITEAYYIENGFLNNVGNVTNNQTFWDTYLSDKLALGRGDGIIETADGQNISWISSDIGRMIDNEWIFYGIILFNNTQSESLSLLNNSMGLVKSTTGPETDYTWLLE